MNTRQSPLRHLSTFAFLFLLLAILAAAPAKAQTMGMDLAKYLEYGAPPGYEQALAAEIRERLKEYHPQTDNLGNVWVTFGSGAPSRLIVAPMDEPGYVVSGITEDGFLRVQRLPQQAPHGLFDQLHSAEAMVIRTRSGKLVTGVVAGLSTHLQGGRRDAPRVNHPDEMYIDIGASSAADVRRAGVDLLDPLNLDRKPFALNLKKITAPAIGDRFGAAVLTELAHLVDGSTLRGTFTIAFVVQQWAGSRGLDRLMQHVKADEMIYVGRLLARRGGAGPQAQQQQAQPRAPKRELGSGVLIGAANPDAALDGFAGELKKLAEGSSLPAATDFTAALPRISYTRGPELPARFAHLGIATAWASTPAELIDRGDMESLVKLLAAYIGSNKPGRGMQASMTDEPEQPRPKSAPPATEILKRLVETYGVSGREGRVREAIEKLLPSWAKPETDKAGNLILHFAVAPTFAKPNKILFVAHMDELGYVIRAIAADGRLEVQTRGGGNSEYFLGHAVVVHRESGDPAFGILELPQGWDQPNFEWPRGPQAGPIRVDIGARSAAEVQERNIKVNDTITIWKKYRPLFGTRANGRSFDDRVGCAALVSAVWALGANSKGGQAAPRLPVDVTFVWSTEEETGLVGAKAVADRLAEEGGTPDFVFAVDTFVSSDSPLESKRFADAPIGKGFVIRAVDGSNITDRKHVDRLIQIAKKNRIPVQYGVTGGGNDGATFLRHGAVDIPIGWPLRYSHSPGEVIDTRDLDALARIVAEISRGW